jgi:hypothetical protein
MWAIRFLRPILKALDQGNAIRTAVVLALRILGVLSVLVGLYVLIEILKLSFQLPTQGTIGGLLFAIVFIAGVASLFQIFFYRAESVRDLGESPFTVIPIFSILFRTLGETYAASGLAVGVGGCIFVWFSGMSPVQLLPGVGGILPAPAGGTFLDGVLFLVWVCAASFTALIVFYFLGEAIVVIADIARNVRSLARERGVTSEQASKDVAA